jgi:hypothetical protein
VNRKEALKNLDEALNLLREVEVAVRDGKIEAGLEFENDFTEAVNEIERLYADLTEARPGSLTLFETRQQKARIVSQKWVSGNGPRERIVDFHKTDHFAGPHRTSATRPEQDWRMRNDLEFSSCKCVQSLKSFSRLIAKEQCQRRRSRLLSMRSSNETLFDGHPNWRRP